VKFTKYKMTQQKVEYRKQNRWGGGLYAREPICRGEVVARFDGDVYEWGESVELLPNDPPLFLRDHVIQFGVGISRDSAAGMGRYANHSCRPNCGIKNLFEIVAMENIPQDTEITWDYAMTENNDWFMTCRCGDPECRKLITGYRNLPPEIRTKYTGFISEWLIRSDIPYEGPAQARELKRESVSNLVGSKSFVRKEPGPLAS
jgi:SET domain-containing protein